LDTVVTGGDRAVLAALASLSAMDRDAVTLLAWDGLSAEEAATVLDCSRATFYVRLHRARRRLAGLLAETSSSQDQEVG
jgi:RNA polymerase sigma-70 factor (ECF subfamily)